MSLFLLSHLQIFGAFVFVKYSRLFMLVLIWLCSANSVSSRLSVEISADVLCLVLFRVCGLLGDTPFVFSASTMCSLASSARRGLDGLSQLPL